MMYIVEFNGCLWIIVIKPESLSYVRYIKYKLSSLGISYEEIKCIYLTCLLSSESFQGFNLYFFLSSLPPFFFFLLQPKSVLVTKNCYCDLDVPTT